MTAKIFKGIFITALSVLVISSALVFVLCFRSYKGKAEGELKRNAEYIAAGYGVGGVTYMERLDLTSVRMILISPSGEVMYDSLGADGRVYADILEREEIKSALRGSPRTNEYRDEESGKRSLGYAAVLDDGFILLLSMPAYSAAAMLGEMITPTVSLITLLLIITFAVAMRLSRSVIEPINELDLEHPEKSKSSAELKPIIDKLSSQKYRISHQMAELRARESEFNNLTENMNVGMIVINSRTEIVSSNKSARAIFTGLDDNTRSILSIKNTPEFKEAIRAALTGGRGYDYIRTDEKYYTIAITPIDKDGFVDGAVIVIIDDTEKEHREALRREFTSNVSHELKTPLTSISGFAELISSGLTTADDSVHFAENIYKEAQRLITLVGDIIRLNQLDGKEIPYDGIINLCEVADEVVSRLENVAGRRNVSITLQGEAASVEGTYLILEEIIYNLIDNAIKYNKDGGRVAVTVGNKDGAAFVTVKDTGIGIPNDKQDRVFERFYRVDKSHSKNIGGTGLGLSIVKHAALYHKAAIELESEEGVGTAITITFPRLKNT